MYWTRYIYQGFLCDSFRHLLNTVAGNIPVLHLNLTDSEDFKGIISFMFWRADVDYPNKISIYMKQICLRQVQDEIFASY